MYHNYANDLVITQLVVHFYKNILFACVDFYILYFVTPLYMLTELNTYISPNKKEVLLARVNMCDSQSVITPTHIFKSHKRTYECKPFNFLYK